MTRPTTLDVHRWTRALADVDPSVALVDMHEIDGFPGRFTCTLAIGGHPIVLGSATMSAVFAAPRRPVFDVDWLRQCLTNDGVRLEPLRRPGR